MQRFRSIHSLVVGWQHELPPSSIPCCFGPLCWCCEVHDRCYSDAMQHDECWPIIDNPYTESYAYDCDENLRKVTCKSNNDACEMFICECDRKAADCFARSPWNPEHEHFPSSSCQ
ncbi:phospholipase A2, major isoenzyme isoform X4 [Salvelinus sp. IW2-2015]|uniref:phospholipase A2, major isoenzyme isoform X4 n=1 Tax=Salvelinus sp. IW2-2015 TaxID=2691554 RepID=UPI0038D4EF7F